MTKRPDFLGLLRALAEKDVDYVIVGGVAAILEGAPIATLDLDIVYSVEDRNLARLQSLLVKLDSRYRDPAGQDIRPTVGKLRQNRVNLLQTSRGLLDAMQEIGAGWTYETLLPRVHTRNLGGLEVRVLDLAAVIESKEAAGRDKDRAMLPILRRTLEMQRPEAD